jgi:hypothetical protein
MKDYPDLFEDAPLELDELGDLEEIDEHPRYMLDEAWRGDWYAPLRTQRLAYKAQIFTGENSYTFANSLLIQKEGESV